MSKKDMTQKEEKTIIVKNLNISGDAPFNINIGENDLSGITYTPEELVKKGMATITEEPVIVASTTIPVLSLRDSVVSNAGETNVGGIHVKGRANGNIVVANNETVTTTSSESVIVQDTLDTTSVGNEEEWLQKTQEKHGVMIDEALGLYAQGVINIDVLLDLIREGKAFVTTKFLVEKYLTLFGDKDSNLAKRDAEYFTAELLMSKRVNLSNVKSKLANSLETDKAAVLIKKMVY